MSGNEFSKNTLTEEEAFWVMRYFLDGHYELAGGEFDLTDILSATQPFELDDNGHFDGEVKGKRIIAPADSDMVWHWNEAVKKFREQGRPKPKYGLTGTQLPPQYKTSFFKPKNKNE